jgi:hypothetical protein
VLLGLQPQLSPVEIVSLYYLRFFGLTFARRHDARASSLPKGPRDLLPKRLEEVFERGALAVKMDARRKKAAHVFQKAYREKTSTTKTPAVTRSGSTLDVRSQIPCRNSSLVFFPKNYRRCDAGDKVATIIKLICAHILFFGDFASASSL